MIYGILIALQMIISVLLVVSILLQASKGGGLAGIAGGMMSSTVFGGRSAANFLTRATTVLATLFMLNCLGMAVLSTTGKQKVSVTQQAVQGEPANSPVPQIPGGATMPEGNNATPPSGGN
ncbi:preprotein translocase subunit SecG [candidate division KSB1 bacterium]|nr:preprotein translocase subunit SecG [candidate division KSB1 bacterium]